MQREILPNNVKPIKYTLDLVPDLEKFVFDGKLIFDFKIVNKTNKIILNSKELNITKCIFNYNILDNKKKIKYDVEKETVIIELDQKLNPGIYKITIEYQGILNDKMAGFYRSKYGNNKYLATTQFEAVDARRALPCMDEPLHKAIFQISLNVPENLIALSNMEVINQIYDNGRKTVYFNETPLMSTYLLAFFVGEADYTESFATIGNKNIPVRVYTPVGESEKGVFARELCVKVLEFFSEYFDIDYPLSKMDMIAIPDFAAGAMENWGLITYRSKYILCDNSTSKSALTQLAYTICHELAHQWFGNLVTMSWWSELWLNEGFATWVGWMAVNHFFPEWNIWDRFYLDEFLSAQQLDSLHNSHPIEVNIIKASEVDEIFDAISYSKGACIISMLVGYLSEETFQKGIIKYLKKFKYSNATTTDLWSMLEESSDKNITDLIETWTKKKGFPIISVENKKDSIRLIQNQFNSDDSKIRWNIPLNINKDNTIINILMKEGSLEIHNFSSKWFKLNNKQTGFFIVNYDNKSLDKLVKPIVDKKISALDRASIINDLFVLSYYSYINLNKALEYISNYNNEDSYTVLSVIITKLINIKSIWYDNKKVIDDINNILESLIKKSLDKIDYIPNNNEEYMISLKRNLILSTALDLNTPKIINIFKLLWDGNINNIHADLRELVYINISKNGTEVDFNKLLKIYENTDCSLEQNQILSALGYSTDISLLKKLLDITFEDNSIVRQQDIPIVIGSIAKNLKGRKLVWGYIKYNWNIICDKLKGGSFLFGRVVSTSIKLMSSQNDLNDINEFISKNDKDLIGLKKTLEQSKENVINRINLRNRNPIEFFHSIN